MNPLRSCGWPSHLHVHKTRRPHCVVVLCQKNHPMSAPWREPHQVWLADVSIRVHVKKLWAHQIRLSSPDSGT